MSHRLPGTPPLVFASELDDTTTPVTLTAKDNLFGDNLGSVTYQLQ